MFELGDYIIYANTGVCRIEEICVPEGFGSENKLYYKLKPAFKPEIVFIPVDSAVYMRKVLTKKEALDFIDSIPEIAEDESAAGLDNKSLQLHYKAFLNTHECSTLAQLIKTIRTKEKDLAEKGKKLIKTDADFMQKAKDILHGELSISLGIPVEEVASFIEARLGQKLNA